LWVKIYCRSDHFGKTEEAGTRGASCKEASADLVLACLGKKALSGSVDNTRLAVRKNRGGRQGQQYPFGMSVVEAPEPDPDGDPVTTLIVNWQPAMSVELYERIEAYVGAEGPYLKPFAREPRPGWTSWGNQKTKFDS
jgi:hypothetical protein